MVLHVFIVGRPGSMGARRLSQFFAGCPRTRLAAPLDGPRIDSWLDAKLSPQDRKDAEHFFQALRATPDGDHALIIRDNSQLSASPSETASLLADIMTETEGSHQPAWDVHQLSCWMDRCEQYDQLQSIRPGQSGHLTMSMRPCSSQGLQALIVSPSGRRKILSGQPMIMTESGPEAFLPVRGPIGAHLCRFVFYGGLQMDCVSPEPFVAGPDLGTIPEGKEREEVKEEVPATRVVTTRPEAPAQKPDYSWLWSLIGLAVIAVAVAALARRRR